MNSKNVFATRVRKQPKRKLIGSSEYIVQYIEKDKNKFAVWDRKMVNSYFFWVCVKTEKRKYKLIKLKNIK